MCKVCEIENQEILEKVNEMFCAGNRVIEVQRYLKEQGIQISFPTIAKHKDCIPDLEEKLNQLANEDLEEITPIPFIMDITKIKKKLGLKLDAKDGHTFYHEITSILLQLWVNQSLVCYQAQNDFMSGKAKSPTEELKLLKWLSDMLLNIQKFDIEKLDSYLTKKGVQKVKKSIDSLNDFYNTL